MVEGFACRDASTSTTSVPRSEAAAAMLTKLDLTLVRIVLGIVLYLVVLALVSIATYALWAGPQQLGVSDATYAFWAGPQQPGVPESWPLVFYFLVTYLGTLLVASGVVAAIQAGPGLVRRYL